MLLRYVTLVLLLALLCIAGQIRARDLAEGLTDQSPSVALQNHNQRYALWTGIGRLKNSIGQTCNAVLLDTRNRQDRAVGPAYVLTSGHCVLFSYGTAHIGQAIDASITFNYFYDAPEQQRTLRINTAHWSSMAGTDLAILELDISLAGLIAEGIMPLKLAEHSQYSGAREVINVGSPGGFRQKGLRMSACKEFTTDSFVEHPGVFPSAMKNRCNDLQFGSSGSPMLDRHTNEITGIVSKVASVIKKEILNNCKNTSACEAARFNYSYPAHNLRHCFVDGLFLNNTVSCQLKPVEITLEEPWNLPPFVHIQQGAPGQNSLPTWNLRFSIEAPFYRFKTVRNVKDCSIPSGYNSATTSTDAYINQVIGPALGAHVLCIIGVTTRNQSLTPALLHNTFTHAVFLMPATPRPQISLNYQLAWEDQHTGFIHYYAYVVPSPAASCADSSDARYAPITGVVTVQASQLPVTVCSYARNAAGQPSATRKDVIDGSISDS
ncbi:trypsin-like serine peptidase [Pseudomonas mucidolens]|uniref:trypsin-like serine peptidase n=1 Tax=Pseudomonas mucidolens TaxID=46679 RepID=UPI0030D6FAEC